MSPGGLFVVVSVAVLVVGGRSSDDPLIFSGWCPGRFSGVSW